MSWGLGVAKLGVNGVGVAGVRGRKKGLNGVGVPKVVILCD